MEDENIIKVGVAPYTDAKYLKDDYNFIVRGKLDLRFVAHVAGFSPGGLAKMSELYLGRSLDKDDQFSGSTDVA